MEVPQGKCCLIVDGSYARSLEVKTGLKIDYGRLCEVIEGMTKTQCDTRVFVDFIPDESKPYIRQLRHWRFDCVTCQMKTETKYDAVQQKEFSCRVQKGADVYIAYYMMLWAFDPRYSHMVVLAGDGDFYPVFKFVKDQNKKELLLLYFNGAVSDWLFPYGSRMAIDEWPEIFAPSGGAAILRPAPTQAPAPAPIKSALPFVPTGRHRVIHVSNMAADFPTEEIMRKLFEPYGEITKITLSFMSNLPYQFARITFANHESAARALEMNGRKAGERHLKVSWHETSPAAPAAPAALPSCSYLPSSSSSSSSSFPFPLPTETARMFKPAAPVAAGPHPSQAIPPFYPPLYSTPPAVMTPGAPSFFMPLPVPVPVPVPPPVPAPVPAPAPLVDPSTTTALYVGNLRVCGITEEMVCERFMLFGSVREVKIFSPKRAARVTGARVEFCDREAAGRALLAMSGSTVFGDPLKISWYGSNMSAQTPVPSLENLAVAQPLALSFSAGVDSKSAEDTAGQSFDDIVADLMQLRLCDDIARCREIVRMANGNMDVAVNLLLNSS